MDTELLRTLLGATLASSVAILLIGAARLPVRRIAGSSAAYWLWLLVPALIVAIWVPPPSQILELSSQSLPGRARAAVSTAIASATAPATSIYMTAGIAIWIAGAAAMLIELIRRQMALVRSLGELTPDSMGHLRSPTAVSPMLVGIWNPRVVLPAAFEARHAAEEREVMLAHEHAHLERRDIAVNAIGAAFLCIFWFNPLVYWAVRMLRADQELACDASVLMQRKIERRRYADALLKTQMAAESGWRMPVGCDWQSHHPLKERISMLKNPLPPTRRRLAGIAGVLALTFATSYSVWAAQNAGEGQRVLVSLKMKVAETQAGESKDSYSAATQYLVHSGEVPAGMDARPYDFVCTPYLPGDATEVSVPAPVQGQVLLDCRVRNEGKVVWAVAVLVADGQDATVESADRNGARKYKLQVSASTSAEAIAAAAKASAAKRQ